MTADRLKTVHILRKLLQWNYPLEVRHESRTQNFQQLSMEKCHFFVIRRDTFQVLFSVWCLVMRLGGKIEIGGSSSKSDVLEDGESHVV